MIASMVVSAVVLLRVLRRLGPSAESEKHANSDV
jgi:hypothetical protein